MKGTRACGVEKEGGGHRSGPTPLRVWFVPLLSLAVVSCHTYEPIVGQAPAPGEDVRVRLTAVRSDELSQRTGRQIRLVEGKVLESAADSFRVDVGWGAIYAGTAFEGRRDTLSFREGQYVEVERKEFSRGRTALVLAGAAVVVAALFRAVGGGGGEMEGPGDGGGDF